MEVLDFLKVHQFEDKIRLGANKDGGYVIGALNEPYDCYISAGISHEESFTKEFIDKYNMNEFSSFAFDGTIRAYPYEYTTNISFIRKNVNSFNDNNNTNLSALIEKYDNIFLKIDIEGGEYPWLLNINEAQLSKFKQIVIEFHGITNDSWGCSNADKIKCLEKLINTHYIIHAHGNNWGQVFNGIPDVIELTYVNKNYFTSPPPLNRQLLPIPNVDFPNNVHRYDIPLTRYPFLHLENISDT